MDAPERKSQFAWQPLTPQGVAAFAHASFTRLFVVQFLTAILVAAAILWVLASCWFPVIGQSIEALPETGQIRSGVLEWTEDSPVRLAEGHFLAMVVDVSKTGLARSTAHVSAEFDRSGWRIFSFFGFIEFREAGRFQSADHAVDGMPGAGAGIDKSQQVLNLFLCAHDRSFRSRAAELMQ